MVATNKDMLHNDEEVTKRKRNVSRQIKRRAEELGLAKVLSKEFVDVNATVDDDNMKVRSEFFFIVCPNCEINNCNEYLAFRCSCYICKPLL